jgi:hypothetical protein
MSQRATGTFDVSLTSAEEPDVTSGLTLGRMAIDKRFHGDLAGVGKGEMLTAITSVEGSAGYVALERVTGTLHGRAGSFVFQHSGRVERGAQTLTITVVPDSGTEQLSGLAGTFALSVVDGRHTYVFDYALNKS